MVALLRPCPVHTLKELQNPAYDLLQHAPFPIILQRFGRSETFRVRLVR